MNPAISVPQYSHGAPVDLRVNLLTHAFGIPRESVAFSWQMVAGGENEIQTGYRIFLARRLEDMEEENYLLDTGWMATDENSHVTVAGLDSLLQDNEIYYWTVQTRNRDGLEGPRSTPAVFSTAVGEEWESTQGIWSVNENERGNFCFLRAGFEVNGADNVECALLSVTALSPEPARQFVYHAFVIGCFVGLGPARLGKDADGEELVYYHTYDVTSLLHEGENALGFLNYTTSEKSLLCQLTVYYRNGSKRVLLNSGRDASAFRGMDGADAFGEGASIGTGYYQAAAQNIHTELFPYGFSETGFSESPTWTPALRGRDMEAAGERRLAPYPGEPVGRYVQEIGSLEDLGDGHYRIDLGQEVVGGIRLTLDSPDLHAITLRYGEELAEDGSVRYRMRTGNVYEETWTLRQGPQTVENYGMMTYRYVDILGCHAALTEDGVKAVAIRQEFNGDASSFACSNETLSELYQTFKYAICATNQDLYVDSQSRERRAYEGDALINMLAGCTYDNHLALARFSTEYLLTHRTWPAEYALITVHLVWLDYLYSGNHALLSQAYAQLRAVVLGAAPDEETGLYPSLAEPNNGWNSILVDWPGVSRDGYYIREAYYNTVYNATFYAALRDMDRMAGVLGKQEDQLTFRNAADALRHAMTERLYCQKTGAFCDGLDREGHPVDHCAQHATAAALCVGAYGSKEMADAMGRWLVAQGGILCSIYGAYYLLSALYKAGFGSYATALMANSDDTPGAHSWAAALHGARVTIAPEAWCFAEKPNMTLSHPWGAAPAALMVNGMLGIRPTRPGFREFDICPQIGDLPYVSARIPTAKGEIVVSLGQNGEAYEAEITVPANTSANVRLPRLPGGSDTLFVNGQKSNYGVETDGCFHVRLGSGVHRLLAQ